MKSARVAFECILLRLASSGPMTATITPRSLWTVVPEQGNYWIVTPRWADYTRLNKCLTLPVTFAGSF